MKITIEKLLQWAFTEELGQKASSMTEAQGSSNFTMIMDVIRLGAIVDRSRNIMAASFALEPHADAVATVEAVRALAKRDFDIAEGWNPFPEWDDEFGLIALAVGQEVETLRLRGECINGRHIAALVYSCAVMGRGPEWEAEAPAVVCAKRNGQDAWFITKTATDTFGRVYSFDADGYDRKRKRPMRGAFQKMELAEPLHGAIRSRLEWQLWQDALCELHKSLANHLVSHDLLPFVPRRQPWVNFQSARENLVSV